MSSLPGSPEGKTFSLGSGLSVHVCADMSPREADVAFASIAIPPVPGPLNTYVLKELGADEGFLPTEQELRSGFAMGDTPADVPVVFVVSLAVSNFTYLSRRRFYLLRDNLSEALSVLRNKLCGKRIWMPLLGTGAAGVPYQLSLASIIQSIFANRRELEGTRGRRHAHQARGGGRGHETTFYIVLPPGLDDGERAVLTQHAAAVMTGVTAFDGGPEPAGVDTALRKTLLSPPREHQSTIPAKKPEHAAAQLASKPLTPKLSHPDFLDSYWPKPGERIGAYELERELGRGGMGVVYLAKDTKLLRRVAIKFLLKSDPGLAQRFMLEARTTARCRHDNIVVIYDIAEHRGMLCLVLEYLEGLTLRDYMRGFRLGPGHDSVDSRPRLSPPKGVDLILPVVRALATAHAQGIVHRDLKPENIFVTNLGSVKVLDFSIAKLFEPEGGWRTSWMNAMNPQTPLSLTQQGALLGTIPYMAPEQWEGKSDHRTDLWAVGIILYELLAGRHPLAPLSLDRLIEVTDYERPMPSLRQAMPELGALGSIVDECLIKDKNARLSSAESLLDRLSHCLADADGTRAPRYPDDATRELGKKLESAYVRKRRLEQAGESTGAVVAEILSLKRALRQGGQLKAGDSLGGDRYLLLGPIGRGGFAQVWEAIDEQRGERVAIKVLHTEIAGDRLRRDRFFRGARIMAELEHEAIVRVIEPYGEDDGYYYFVMELVSGSSLARAVMSKRVGPEQAVSIALAVGEALGQAHRRGYVHRDIKPDNILISDADAPKLTDFDLVAARDTTGGTHTGALGTFLYAPPEMLDRPQDADQTADVYGLAMTVVFMLYGDRLPVTVMRDTGAFIDGIGVGSAIKQTLKKALSWDTRQRFADADAFCQALRQAAELSVVTVRPEG